MSNHQLRAVSLAASILGLATNLQATGGDPSVQPVATMNDAQREQFQLGDALFELGWQDAHSSTNWGVPKAIHRAMRPQPMNHC